jgi:hypothetical protein
MTPRQRLVSVPFAITARNLKGGTAEADSLKLNPTASSAMVAATGKMYFNNDTKRMQYYDSTQWISLDPPYTSKPIKIASRYTTGTTQVIPNPMSVGSSATIFRPSVDCVLVGCSGYSGGLATSGYQYYRFKIRQGTNDKVHFVVHVESLQRERFNYSFPFPIKVNAGADVVLECTEASYTGAGVKDFALYYIELPLD